MAAVDTRAAAAMAQVDHGVDYAGVAFETAVADGADGSNVVLNHASENVDEGVDMVNDAFDAVSNIKRPTIRREVTRTQQRVERRREEDSIREPHQIEVTPQMERTAKRQRRQPVVEVVPPSRSDAPQRPGGRPRKTADPGDPSGSQQPAKDTQRSAQSSQRPPKQRKEKP